MRQRVGEDRLCELPDALEDVRAAIIAQTGWGGTGGVQPDDDHPTSTEFQRRFDRRVQTRPTIDVPAAGLGWHADLDRAESARDRRRRAHMVAREPTRRILDTAQLIDGHAAAAGVEHDAATGHDRRRDHRRRMHNTRLHVRPQLVGVQTLGDGRGQGRAIEHRLHPTGPTEHPQRVTRERGQRARRPDRHEHVLPAHRTPQPGQRSDDPRGRLMEVARQPRAVQRADARTDDHRHALTRRLQLGQQNRQSTGLVRATGTTPSEHQPDPRVLEKGGPEETDRDACRSLCGARPRSRRPRDCASAGNAGLQERRPGRSAGSGGLDRPTDRRHVTADGLPAATGQSPGHRLRARRNPRMVSRTTAPSGAR